MPCIQSAGERREKLEDYTWLVFIGWVCKWHTSIPLTFHGPEFGQQPHPNLREAGKYHEAVCPGKRRNWVSEQTLTQ